MSMGSLRKGGGYELLPMIERVAVNTTRSLSFSFLLILFNSGANRCLNAQLFLLRLRKPQDFRLFCLRSLFMDGGKYLIIRRCCCLFVARRKSFLYSRTMDRAVRGCDNFYDFCLEF